MNYERDLVLVCNALENVSRFSTIKQARETHLKTFYRGSEGYLKYTAHSAGCEYFILLIHKFVLVKPQDLRLKKNEGALWNVDVDGIHWPDIVRNLTRRHLG